MVKRRSVLPGAGVFAVMLLAGVSGCNCGSEGLDAGGGDSGPALLSTSTIIKVQSDVIGIRQLHVVAVLEDPPNMGGTCDYATETREGVVPEIVAADLDLSMETTFFIAWAGDPPTISDLGPVWVTPAPNINCRFQLSIEALDGAGGTVIASGSAEGFAFYATSWETPSAAVLMP